MRIHVIVLGLALMIFAGAVMGMGKSDESKEEVKSSIDKKPTDVKADVSDTSTDPVEAKPAKVEAGKVASIEPVEKKPTADKSVEDKVVVTVNGVKIMQSQIDAGVDKRLKMQFERMQPAQMESMKPEVIERMKEQLRTRTAEMMVERQLLEGKLKAKKIEVTDAEVKAKVEEIVKQQGMSLDKFLSQYGITPAEFDSQMRMGLGAEKLITSEMTEKVTEEDAKKYYDENAQQFSRPETVRASHILIKTDKLDEAGKVGAKAKIEGLLKQVKAGGDFAEFAKTHSGCPSGAGGGDLGFFEKGRMVPEFSDAAFALKEGDVSGVVETQFGYHIIKLTGRKAASTLSFEEVKDKLMLQMGNKKKEEFWRGYRQKLKSEANIVWAEGEEKPKRKVIGSSENKK